MCHLATITFMETVSIHMLHGISRSMQATIHAGQQEAGRVWSECTELHVDRRKAGLDWPNRNELQKFTKGRFALHSQTVQMIVHQLLSNVDATRERRRNDPESRFWLKYPYKEKKFFPLYWPAQAVSYNASEKRLVLPMGRGRKSLVFRLDLDFAPGAAKLVWNDGYELHLVRPVAAADEPPGTNRACVDLGEIHLAAAVTDTGKALVVSGRDIRSEKRLLSKQLGQIARKRSGKKKGSRRWRKLQAIRMKRSKLAQRRIRDKRHKATRKVIDFCQAEGVGSLYVGDPRGVRNKDCGRHHNQRVARWEMGKDISYLSHKAELAAIACFTGEERGTSSRCPQCGHRHKPRGRVWACKKCGFIGPRDVVGGANMHRNGFSTDVMFPAEITYRRPAPSRAGRGMNNRAPIPAERRSSLDTGQGISPVACLGDRTRTAGLPVHRKVLSGPATMRREAHSL
jgi:putative transposase